MKPERTTLQEKLASESRDAEVDQGGVHVQKPEFQGWKRLVKRIPGVSHTLFVENEPRALFRIRVMSSCLILCIKRKTDPG